MIAALAILILYSAFIIQAVFSWNRIRSYDDTDDTAEFSIIIPYRNENENLADLLESIKEINYPHSKFEIIFVNDESEDNSVEIVQEFSQKTDLNIRLLDSKGGKKAAVQIAVSKSKFEFILQSDADNIISENILQAYSSQFKNTDSILVAGPVINKNPENYFQKIALVEFSSLLVSSAAFIEMGNPIMINAANFCYKKSILNDLEVDGSKTSSGDDIFLLNAILKKFGSDKISFLKNKNALVETSAPKSLKEFVSQRIRWTSKDRKVKNKSYLFIASFIFICNFYLLSFFIWSLFSVANPITALFFLLIKLNLDALLIYKYLKFSDKTFYIKYIIQAFILSILQISIIGIIGHFIQTKWKGRKVKI